MISVLDFVLSTRGRTPNCKISSESMASVFLRADEFISLKNNKKNAPNAEIIKAINEFFFGFL